jgi:hypothetical protein
VRPASWRDDPQERIEQPAPGGEMGEVVVGVRNDRQGGVGIGGEAFPALIKIGWYESKSYQSKQTEKLKLSKIV